MFYPGSGSDHFLIPDPDLNIFYPGSYMKIKMQTYFLLASYAFRSKVLVLVIVKEIQDQEKNSSRIQGVKKHRIPDPQH
jgi:hypothetical protein